MARGQARKGLPRSPVLGLGDPDLQLLYDSLRYHGGLSSDPADAREGELWLRSDLDPVELRGFVGGVAINLLASGGGVGTVSWADVTDTPTTLAGYEITDAVADGDPRLTDARTPTAHAASHYTGPDALSFNSIPGSLDWSKVSKVGSSLADLVTRSASDLNAGTLPYPQLPAGAGSWNASAVTLLGTLQSTISSASTLGIAQLGLQNTNGGKLYSLRVGSAGMLSLIDDTRAAAVLQIAGSTGFATFPGGATFGVRLGVGSGGGIDARLLNVQGAITSTATTQYGIVSSPTLSTSATAWGRGVHARVTIPLGLAIPDTAAFYAGTPTLTGSAARSYGYYCEDITGGYAFYSAGIAASRFGGHVAVGGDGSFGGSAGAALWLANITTAPGSAIIGGGVLYVQAGALKYKGTAGSVTVLGPA